MVLQRREQLFSTPCERLCPHMFLNCRDRPNRDPVRKDNPYIVTPRVAYELGMLDATFGQPVFFPTTSKISFRIEVPVWCEIARACQFSKHQSQAQAADSSDATPASLA